MWEIEPHFREVENLGAHRAKNFELFFKISISGGGEFVDNRWREVVDD